MISIERSSLAVNLAANPVMNAGLSFLNVIRHENMTLLEDGLSPAIVGGAPRDVLFGNSTPNDIDIFFYRNNRTPDSTTGINRSLNYLRENLLVWLDDNEIEFRSLLSENAAAYFGSQRFLDIIEFQYQGATIQVMIPQDRMHTPSGIANLLATMPLVSGIAVTLERVITTNAFIAACELRGHGVYPAAHDRDLQYLRRKVPSGQILRTGSAEQLVFMALGRQGALTYSVNSTVSFDDMSGNTANNILRLWCSQKLGLQDSLITVCGPMSLPPDRA